LVSITLQFPSGDGTLHLHSAVEPTRIAIPAVLIADPGTAGLRVIALTLLDRLLVAAHRGGCYPITVVATGPLPDLRRTQALGIAFDVATQVPPLASGTLVANTRQLVLAGDIRQIATHGGRLVASDGTVLPAGRIESTPAGETDPWKNLRPVKTLGVAHPVHDESSASAAGEALWASLNSSADGTVDRHFNRPVGRRLLSRWLVHTPITPNQISVGATLLGVLAGILFGLGSKPMSIVAAVLFQVSAIIDCVDGDVARAVYKESPLGKWLDIVGDQVVHASVFIGIAAGLWRGSSAAPFLWLGGSAVLGGLISFVVVLRGMRQPGGADGPLQKLIDGATNRDFSVLVLILSIVDRLGWFLWLAAIGSHVFWILALTLQLRLDPKAASRK
jgi:phosphatidylglycerophosphate synthase